MLFEKFTHSLDREGRLALPARLRDLLGDDLKRGLVLTCGAETCLVAYTQERFGVLLGQLEGDTGISRSTSRAFKRAIESRLGTGQRLRESHPRKPSSLGIAESP